AGYGEHQARARRFTIDEDRASPADTVLAAKMRAGQIAALAQKIGQRQSRRHIIGDGLAVDRYMHRSHRSTWLAARIAATVCRFRWNSSKYRSVARSRSALTASPTLPRRPSPMSREVSISTSGAPFATPRASRA